jgi:enterochelin esterase family protein
MDSRPGHDKVAGARLAIEAAYADRDHAFLERDVDRFLGHHAADFTVTLISGATIGRADLAALVEQQVSGYDVVGPVTTEIDGLDTETETGQVTVTVHRLLFWGSRDAYDPGRLNEGFDEERLRDRWMLDGDRWLIAHSEVLGPESMHGSVVPEPPRSPRLAGLEAELAAGNGAAMDAFWDEISGRAPLVEPLDGERALVLVTFIRRSARADSATVGGGLMWTAINKPLTRLADTDLWFHTEVLPATGRFNYWFQVEERRSVPRAMTVTRQLSDPLNARPTEGADWFELPAAPPQPYVAERPDVPRGQLTQAQLRSAVLGAERPYSVYLPADYRPDAGVNPLVVLFDGEFYGGGPNTIVPTPRIIDNLVAERRIPPVALLLVHNLPGRRARELTCSPAFEEFVALELVPHVRDTFGAGRRAAEVVVGGSSNGGLAAAYCGLRHPEVFGNVLAMSGAFSYTPDWPPASAFPFGGAEGWIMRQFQDAPKLPLRFWLNVGRFELGLQVLTSRHLRSVLELKGYRVTYSEFDGGHTYAAWRGSLADGLIDLLG